jgi:glucose/arabinose dehydrogenase
MRVRRFGQRVCFIFLLACALTVLNGCGATKSTTTAPPAGPPPTKTLALTPVVSGLTSPVGLETANDGTGRLFVVEQPGMILVIKNGAALPTPFLDITPKVNFDGAEQGLLGLTFHPNYPTNPHFYLNYDRLIGAQIQTVIAEYAVSAANPDQADPTSERILLTVNQPFTNHKAGQMAFGADGFLYFGLGDGGSAGDPLGNGQNLQTLLGKMLRIDVDHTGTAGQPYAIPSDNPFVGGGGLPEIFAFGFRNPWRFSFDRPTGRVFVADVGQARFEEIDILQKGGNFGWNIMEGLHCFNPMTGCKMTGLILPIFEYDHTQGIAVIGGFVYHGTAIPQLAGTYLFSDFGSGTLWNLTEGPPGTWTRSTLLSTGRSISSLGQDSAGELYMVDLSGTVLKLIAQ